MNGNTWTFSLPTGLTQHYYSPNTRFEGGGQVFAVTFVAGSLLQAGTVAGGSPGVVATFGAAGEQTGVFLKRGLLNGWTLLSQGVGNDFNIGRWNDAGAFQGNALSLIRATGAVLMPALQLSTTYANDAAAAVGGVAVGQLYRSGSAVQVRVS